MLGSWWVHIYGFHLWNGYWILLPHWIVSCQNGKSFLHKTVHHQSIFTIETVIDIVQKLVTIMVAFILAASSAFPSTVTRMTKFQTCLSLWLHISVKLSRVLLVIRIYIRTCLSLSLENLTLSTHQLLHYWFKHTPDLVLCCGFSEWASAITVSIKMSWNIPALIHHQFRVHQTSYSYATMHSYDKIFKC